MNTSFGELGWFYLWPDSGLFAGSNATSKLHRHYALQITYVLSPPCRIRTNNQSNWNEWYGFVALPGHRFQAEVKGRFVTVFIDVNHPHYWSYKNSIYASRAQNGIAPIHVSPILIEELDELYDSGFTDKEAKAWIESDVISMFCPSGGLKTIDSRIQSIQNYIENILPNKPSLLDIASLVDLSSSHVMTLFKQQVGITIRRYVLWRRLKRALVSITKGESLTIAAHNAGFTDSAHLTHTFVRMFGFNPYMLFKHSAEYMKAIQD